MTKKIFMSALSAVVLLVAGYTGYKTMPVSEESDLLLANVEALSRGEALGTDKDCHDTNGSKQWDTSSKDPSATKKEFYDCCSVLRTGYNPEGSCN